MHRRAQLVALGVAVVVVGVVGATARAAEAARKPTFREREAITAALPAWFKRYPVGCVAIDIAVSNNGRFARVTPVFLNATRAPCGRYASNGDWILKKGKTWKLIFSGSDAPPCSLGIPKDLIGAVCAK
jgi:hypothetical protein